jgi:(1->4)-alpha-D-glucan 1-alpha-D-glucosylmutase
MNLSLVQVALKATAPGVPDFYQGTELWDLSLVDPDNRRPVDYALRREQLATLEKSTLDDLLGSWTDGRVKLHVIRSILRHRREQPALYARGAYVPVAVTGEQAGRVVAFLRQDGPEQLLVVALRHLGPGETRDLRRICGDAVLELPATPATWDDLFSTRRVDGSAPRLPVAALLEKLPVGVFRAVPAGV